MKFLLSDVKVAGGYDNPMSTAKKKGRIFLNIVINFKYLFLCPNLYIMKKVAYDPNGGKLWIRIDMTGIYFITYIYQMWAATADEHPILTKPLRQNSNELPQPDYYLIQNDYKPGEPLINFDKRVLDISFRVRKYEDDNGYKLRVSVLQGDDFNTAKVIGSSQIGYGTTATLGTDVTGKQEDILLQLIVKQD